MIPSRLWLALLCVLCALGGWKLGSLASPRSEVQPAIAAEREEPAAAPLSAPVNTEALSVRLADALAITGSPAGNPGQEAALLAIAESLPLGELPTAVATLAAQSQGPYGAAGMAGYWVERDPVAAIAWFSGLPEETQVQFGGAVLDTWGRMQPGAALEWLEKIPEPRLAKILGAHHDMVATRLGPDAPDRVLALLGKLPPGPSPQDGSMRASGTDDGAKLLGHMTPISTLFEALGRRSPAAAAIRVNAMPGGANRTAAAVALVTTWAVRDPMAAKAWVETQDDAALAARVLPALAMGWVIKDPPAAAEWMASQPDTKVNQWAMGQLISTWASQNAAAALDWIDSQPPNSGMERYAREIIDTMGRGAPQKTADLLLQRMQRGQSLGGFQAASLGYDLVETQDVETALRTAERFAAVGANGDGLWLFGNIVNGAAQRQPAAVAKWALSQPPGERRQLALAETAKPFVERDRAAALEWALSLPAEADYDDARTTIASGCYTTEPETAMKLYAAVTDLESVRDLRFNKMLFWLRREPEKARAWMEASPSFTPTERAELLKRLRAKK